MKRSGFPAVAQKPSRPGICSPQPRGLWLAGPEPGGRQALPPRPPHHSHVLPRPHAQLSAQPSVKGCHPNAFPRGLERPCPTKNHRVERHLVTSRPRGRWTQNSAPHRGQGARSLSTEADDREHAPGRGRGSVPVTLGSGVTAGEAPGQRHRW